MKFASQTKTQLIQCLVAPVEQREVAWVRTWEVLTDEMKRYEYAISPGGTITYSAPSGFHDDCVVALALAVSGRHNSIHVGNVLTIWCSRAAFAMQMHPRVLPQFR